MFEPALTKRLEEDLSKKLVLQRYDGLDYIAGQVAIEHANAIFGYGNWGYGVKEIKRDGKFIHAIVWVEVFKNDRHEGMVHKEDLGIGKIEMTKGKKDKKGNVVKEPEELQEMAYKGAVTDGLKRALRTFGKQFGLGLYDEKDQMQYIIRELTPGQKDILKPFVDRLQKCQDLEDLEIIGKELTEEKTAWTKPMIVYTAQVYKTTEDDIHEEINRKEVEEKAKGVEEKKEEKKPKEADKKTSKNHKDTGGIKNMRKE